MIINSLKNDIIQNKLDISNLKKSIENQNNKIFKLKYETINQKIIIDYILNNISNNNITEQSITENFVLITHQGVYFKNKWGKDVLGWSFLYYKKHIKYRKIKNRTK